MAYRNNIFYLGHVKHLSFAFQSNSLRVVLSFFFPLHGNILQNAEDCCLLVCLFVTFKDVSCFCEHMVVFSFVLHYCT